MKSDWCNIRVSIPWRSSGNFRNIQIWLLDTVNERDWDYDGADIKNLSNRIYYFAHQADATLFALRWS